METYAHTYLRRQEKNGRILHKAYSCKTGRRNETGTKRIDPVVTETILVK